MAVLNDDLLINYFDKVLNLLYCGKEAEIDLLVDAVSFVDHPEILDNAWFVEEHLANNLI